MRQEDFNEHFRNRTKANANKIIEEADETEYWLKLILETNLSINLDELNRLIIESTEITKIMSKAKSTTSS